MANVDLVEELWGKYTIHKVRPEDTEKVIQHIKDYFLRNEPTSALIGYTEEFGEEFSALTRKNLPDGLSLWMEDNETGNVAAVRITHRRKKDFSPSKIKINSRPFKELKRLVDMCMADIDLFSLYNVDEYAWFSVASCAPKYQKQGLVTELYKRSLTFLAASGFGMATSVFTSPYSRAAARKLGFEEITRVYHKNVMDEDGSPVYDPNILTAEHYAALLCKKL